MEKINIAELLKDCPQGMELYSPIFGTVYLDEIRPHLAIVVVVDKEQSDFKEEFLCDGRYRMNGECMLFPSKDNTTWEGFHRPFKDGDVVAFDTAKGVQLFIFKEYIYDCDRVQCYMMLDDDEKIYFDAADVYVKRLATEEEKEKLFKAIKDNGYEWNAETKTLEKVNVPKFKVGDRITNGKASITIGYIDDNYYYEIGRSIASRILIKEQDKWRLDKIDISTLVPFESRVLVRNIDEEPWKPAIYGFSHSKGYYTVGGGFWKYCIPYENNEHLLGKTDDCEEYYKTWEK